MTAARPTRPPDAAPRGADAAGPGPAADVDALRPVRRDDVAPNTRRGGDIRLTLGPRTVGATSGFGGFLRLGPGEYVAEHLHPYSEEFLHAVTGNLELTLEGRHVVALGPGESAFVPVGVRHRLVCRGTEPAEVVFHLSPLAPRPELGHVDTEELPRPDAPLPDVGGVA